MPQPLKIVTIIRRIRTEARFIRQKTDDRTAPVAIGVYFSAQKIENYCEQLLARCKDADQLEFKFEEK